MISDLLARFMSGAPTPSSVALTDPTAHTPRDCTALLASMKEDPRVRQMRDRIAKRWGSVYAGATIDRLTGDFNYSLRSPDMELKTELRVLRSRARQLAHDNSNIRKACIHIASKVVGAKGHRLLAKHETADSPPLPHTRANKAIEAAWKDFSKRKNAIASRDMTLAQVAALVLVNLFIDGEVFIHRRRGFANDHGYTLDLIDPDQFDETYFRYAFADNQTEIRMGVEINSDGEPVAYWPWKRHPSEYTQQVRIRIPAANVLHVFLRRRPRQTRGETWLAPIIRDIQMHGGYQFAELAGSRWASSKGGFFETDPTKGGEWPTASEDGAAEDLNNRGIMMSSDPGTIEQLPPGVSFKAWDPQHPTNAFEPFTRTILHSAAAGIGLSYASFTGDLSQGNYSSLREGKLMEDAGLEVIQELIDSAFYEPVYEDWVPMAMLTGALKLPTNDASRWIENKQFIPPGSDWVDPFKDMQANSLEVAMGLTSRRRLCAERGVVFEEILAELAEEKALQEQYGVELALDTRLTNQPGAGGSTDDKAPVAGASGGGDDGGRSLETRVSLNGHNRVIQVVPLT